MSLVKNDWIWVRGVGRMRLGLVLAVREHTVLVRLLYKDNNQLQSAREVFSKRIVEKAELTREELYKLPCGKRPLLIGRAKQIVATNRIFTDNPNRKERRVYYCTRCKAFHTTAQFKLPIEILKNLTAHPYVPALQEDYSNGRARKSVWRWLRDTIGIRVAYRKFDLSLIGYGDDSKRDAVNKIILDPLDYIHYLFLFLYNRRKELHEKAIEQKKTRSD